MQLAGVVNMGKHQEGLRPELLKYLFVKDQEASEQQSGKTTFWVFNQSQGIDMAGTASTERQEKSVPENTASEVSTVKQTAITDFFSPRPSTSSTKVAFITPCPSVTLAEVPAMFVKQANIVDGDHVFDPMHPVFKDWEPCPPKQTDMDTETAIKHLEATMNYFKRQQRGSPPTSQTMGCNRSGSDFSSDETLLGSSAQISDSSSPTPPKSGKEVRSRTFSSPSELAATDLIGTPKARDTKKDKSEQDTEKYWIEKDGERLAVIADMEKTMATMKRELANTVNAFQTASGANHKLQAELNKKAASVLQVEEDRNHLVHNLDVAEMDNEKLKKELAHSRRDHKYQFDRAEEALILMEADSSKESTARLLQAKAEAESRNMAQVTEMESEMDFLKSQLKERCDSVAHLTKSLSRVADSDRWKDIKKEMEELKERANGLPDEIQAAWLECEKRKGQYDTLWKKHEELILEQASLEKAFQDIKQFDLRAMREMRRTLKNKAATSERALKGCLKQVFERMIRCSLCLENEGFLPFDKKHRTIYEQVLELTGKDYQQALFDYYDEDGHDIQTEFNLNGGEDEDEDEDGDEDDHEDEEGRDNENGGQFGNDKSGGRDNDQGHDENGGQFGNDKSSGRDNDQGHDDGHIGNTCNVGLHESDFEAGPAENTQDSPSAPTPVMTEDGHLVVAAAKEEAVQESPDIPEAWNKREVDHTARSPVLSPTIVDQAEKAVAGSSVVAQDQRCISSDDVVPTLNILSPGGTGESTRDSHQPRYRGPVEAPKIDDIVVPSTNEVGVHKEGTGVNHDQCEDSGVVLEDNCLTDEVVEEGSGHVKAASNDAVLEGDAARVNDATAADRFSAKIRMIEANIARVRAIDGTAAEKRKALSDSLKFETAIIFAELARQRAGSNLRKQPLFAGEKTVSAPAASTEPGSSEGFAFRKPFSTSKSAEATDLSSSASSNGPEVGRTFEFRPSKNPPPSLFAKPPADSKANSGEGSTAPESLRTSKAAAAVNPSSTGKGNSQDIWKDVSFTATKKTSFTFTPTPATDLEAKLKGQSPVFKSFSFPENKTSASENSEAKQGSEATEAQKEAVTSTTENDISFSQPQGFNFGGNSGPVSFTASSPSFPAGVTQPAATGIFPFKEQVSPSVTVQPKEKIAKDEAAMVKKDMPKIETPKQKAPEKGTSSREETPGEETPEVDASEDESPQEKKLREKKLRKKMLREGNAAKEETPKEATPPSASEPSRKQKQAAKKEQEKAAKKAEREAVNVKVQARRRVQQAMGMR